MFHKKKLLIIITAVILLSAGTAVFFVINNNVLTKKYRTLIENINNYGIQEFADSAKECKEEWKYTSLFDIINKNNIIHTLENIADNTSKADKELSESLNEVNTLINSVEDYNLLNNANDYNSYLSEWKEAVEKKSYYKAVNLQKQAKESLDELINTNNEYINNKLKLYETADLNSASIDEKTFIDQEIDKIKQLAADNAFNQLKLSMQKVDDSISAYLRPNNPINLEVQQVDATEYPQMKLYLHLKDLNTGELPSYICNSMFCVRKQDAEKGYVRQNITHVTRLNESQALNIDITADVSASMEGKPLEEAKSVMADFINKIQFDAGDKLELTSFSTGVHLEQEFCGDKTLLHRKINNLQINDKSSLYDGLYTSVTRVAAQSGAKCVIAYADGNDNYSNCDSSQVINVAKRYCIPVFIIGIGKVQTKDFKNICDSTGGVFYNVNAASEMNKVFDEIYSREKQLYMIEFCDDSGNKVSDESNIIVSYQSVQYGGESSYAYHPNVLQSVDGNSLYSDGPEAVVENYIKNYDDAMTYSDFSYIEPYLEKFSSIYYSQKEYVTNEFSVFLNAYEIVGTNYIDDNSCVVTTLETYYVQKENVPLNLMTQKCKYKVDKDKVSWLISDFADQVKVMYRINK